MTYLVPVATLFLNIVIVCIKYSYSNYIIIRDIVVSFSFFVCPFPSFVA